MRRNCGPPAEQVAEEHERRSRGARGMTEPSPGHPRICAWDRRRPVSPGGWTGVVRVAKVGADEFRTEYECPPEVCESIRWWTRIGYNGNSEPVSNSKCRYFRGFFGPGIRHPIAPSGDLVGSAGPVDASERPSSDSQIPCCPSRSRGWRVAGVPRRGCRPAARTAAQIGRVTALSPTARGKMRLIAQLNGLFTHIRLNVDQDERLPISIPTR
jgi:hypothetical protein